MPIMTEAGTEVGTEVGRTGSKGGVKKADETRQTCGAHVPGICWLYTLDKTW